MSDRNDAQQPGADGSPSAAMSPSSPSPSPSPPPLPPPSYHGAFAASTSSMPVEADPPSLAAQTKTADGSDRKRIYRACEVCRRKKIRCDGLKPCKPCARMSETCVFLDDTSKSSYSKKYVESLESRLKNLENMLAKNNDGSLNAPAMDAMATSSSSSTAAPTRPRDGNGPASYFPTSKPGVLRMSLVAMGNDEACAGRLQTDEEGNRRYIGPSAALGILCDAASLALGPSANTGLERSILPASAELRILSGGPGVSLASIVPSYPSADGVSLPPRDLAEALLRTFFDTIHPIFPVLNEQETRYKCALIYESIEHPPPPSAPGFSSSSSAGPDRTSMRNDPLVLATMFAVFACASRVLKDPRVCTAFPSAAEAENEGYADVYQHQFDTTTTLTPQGEQPPPLTGPNFALAGLGFFERAQVLSLHRASDTRLEQVQCTALLALYMSACNCGARAWIIAGTALRVAIDIGIHRAIMPLEMSVAELEMRRRVWSCVYTIDRLLGIALGRPLGIEEFNHDQLRPSLSLESRPAKLMPGFNLLVDLLQMQALLCRSVTRLNNARSQSDLEAVNTLRAQALGFESHLAAWMARVPPHLRNPTSEPGSAYDIQSVVLMATFHSAEMLLYRCLVQDSQKKPSNTLSKEDDEVLKKATRTALKIIKLAPQMSVLAATHFTLEFSQQLLVAASFLGLNAYRHRGSDAITLFSQADEGVLGLRLLEPNFPGARNLRKTLSRVIKALRQKCGIAQPSATGAKPSRPGPRASTESNVGSGPGPIRPNPTKHRSQPYPSRLSASAGPPMGIARLISPSSPQADPSSRSPDAKSAQGSTPPDLPSLSFSVFSGNNRDGARVAQHSNGSTQQGQPSAMSSTSMASSTPNASLGAPAVMPDYFDGATMSTDFHFDGGFDAFAALELFTTCDLSALIGADGTGPQPSLSFGTSSTSS